MILIKAISCKIKEPTYRFIPLIVFMYMVFIENHVGEENVTIQRI